MKEEKKLNDFIISKNILIDLDNCVENLRCAGLNNKMIALNLITVASLVKKECWDEFYIFKTN